MSKSSHPQEGQVLDSGLNRSEDGYKVIFNAVSDGIILHDPKTGDILEVNETMLQMLGYTQEEMLNLNLSAITQQNDCFNKKKAVSLIIAASKGKTPLFEWLLCKKDGTKFWVEVGLRKIILNGKKIVLASVTDIDAEKNYEQQLHESEERMKDLFDNVDDIIQTVDHEGRFVYVNRKWKELFGYTEAEMKTLKFTDIIRKDHIRACTEFLSRVCAGHPVHNIEMVFVTKKGKEFIVSGNANAFFKKGKFVYTRSIFRDITEQKKTEEDLRESEARHRMLFESSRDAIMTLAPPSWKFTSGNQAAVELFGTKDENQFTLLGPGDLSPEIQPDGEKSAAQAARMIGLAMEQGHNFFGWTHRKYKGASFPATVLLTRVDTGKEKFLQATVRDVTEQKKAEAELTKRNEDLENFHKIAVDRELRMIELKKKIAELETRLSEESEGKK